MDENAPPGKPFQGLQCATNAVDRHVAHAAPGFLSRSSAQHLVVREQRAVKQDDVGASKTLAHSARYGCSGRDEDEPRAVAMQFDSDIGCGLDANFRIGA